MRPTSGLAQLCAILLYTTTATAQDNATDEAGKLCSLQLQTKAGLLQRTDDWDLVPSTNTTLWPAAQLYLTTEDLSRMYSNDGGRCGFNRMFCFLPLSVRGIPRAKQINRSPDSQILTDTRLAYLRCSTITNLDSTKYGFYISSNGSLTFANSTLFWQCANTDDTTSNAAPYIYPPIDTISGTKLPDNCTALNLTSYSSRCEATSGDDASQFTITPSSILTTASLVGGAGGGVMQTGANGFLAEAVIAAVGVVLAWL